MTLVFVRTRRTIKRLVKGSHFIISKSKLKQKLSFKLEESSDDSSVTLRAALYFAFSFCISHRVVCQ